MNNVVSFYKSNLPIIILIIYSIGYIFLISYYFDFGIEIVYFISVTDILFTSIDLIISFIITSAIFEVFILIITSILHSFFKNKKDGENIEEVKKNGKNFKFISFLITCITLLFLILFVDNIFTYAFLLSILMLSKFYNLLATTENKNNKEINKFIKGVLLSIIIVIILGTYIFAHIVSEGVKEKKDYLTASPIEFKYNEKFYSTEIDTLKLFIGQTSDFLFLYDLNTKKTSVFDKNKIVGLKFKDPTIEIKERVNSFFKKKTQ